MQPNVENGPGGSGRINPALILYPLGHVAVEIYNSMVSIAWPLIATRFSLSYGAIGLLNMVYRTSMTLPQAGFAALGNRRWARLLPIVGVAWVAVGISLIGLAPTVAGLAVLLALAPLGSAAVHPIATAYTGQALPRRRGTAVAIFLVGGSLGSSLGPVVGAWLFQRHGLPGSLTLLPLGLGMAALMALRLPAAAGTTGRAGGAVQPRAPIPPVFFLLMASSVLINWLEVGVNSYLPLLVTSRGLPLTTASQVLFAISIMSAAGNLTGGALSDRIPRWQVITLALGLTVPMYLGTLLLGGPWALLAPAGLGFAYALSHPSTVALGQELMPDRTSLASALTMGVAWVIGSWGAALTAVLADRIGMQNALLLNSVLPVLGIGCMLALYRMGRRTMRPGTVA